MYARDRLGSFASLSWWDYLDDLLRTFSVTDSATKRVGCNVYLSSCNQETKSLVMRDPGRQPPTRQPFCCPEFISATYYVERTRNGGTYPQDMPRLRRKL